MISQCITLIDQGRQVVATAQVAEQDGSFIGQINLRSMPVPLQRLFKEYEEIVNTHMFSCLDEIEEKVEALHLKVVFEDGYEAALTDVQIYPSTNKVSFQALKGVVSRPSTAYRNYRASLARGKRLFLRAISFWQLGTYFRRAVLAAPKLHS